MTLQEQSINCWQKIRSIQRFFIVRQQTTISQLSLYQVTMEKRKCLWNHHKHLRCCDFSHDLFGIFLFTIWIIVSKVVICFLSLWRLVICYYNTFISCFKNCPLLFFVKSHLFCYINVFMFLSKIYICTPFLYFIADNVGLSFEENS